MANFHVHEDVSSLIENVKPKNQKLTKVFPHAKNRAVLQPLCSYQQNAKPRKPDPEKENRAIVATVSTVLTWRLFLNPVSRRQRTRTAPTPILVTT
jgi:hypothetical protein